MENQFLIEEINGTKICLKGIGKLFYQNGLPIGISISKLKEKGIKVSVLHIADECLKHGWSPKTTFQKLKAEIEDDISNNQYNVSELESFCFESYENQRDMIFKSLFKDKESAVEFLRSKSSNEAN